MRITHRITIQEISSGQRSVHEVGGYALGILVGEQTAIAMHGAATPSDLIMLLATLQASLERSAPGIQEEVDAFMLHHSIEHGAPAVELIPNPLPSPPELITHEGVPVTLQRIVVTEIDDPAHPVVFDNLTGAIVLAHQLGMPDNKTLCMIQHGLTVDRIARLFSSFCIALQTIRPGLARKVLEQSEQRNHTAEFLEITRPEGGQAGG